MTTKIRDVGEPGDDLHIWGRTVGRRPLFEAVEDRQFFFNRLGQLVDQARVQVHAYSLMTNHYHLLVRNVDGDLSATMRDLPSVYVIRFNQRRRRDGPLMKGHFGARVIDGPENYARVVRYIDANPVAAGMVKRCIDYAWGSARHYAQPPGPAWLSRSVIEESG